MAPARSGVPVNRRSPFMIGLYAVLLGIVGVLVAIPVAAAIRQLQEVAFPRLDKS